MKVAKWKIDRIATVLAEPSVKGVNEAREKAQDAARKWALAHVPQQVRLMCAKYPRLDEDIYLYFCRTGESRRSERVYLKKFPTGDKFLENAQLPEDTEASKLCQEWHLAEEQQKDLRNSIRCALNRINTYARFKDEFPEAYEVLLVIDKAESEGDKPCTCDAVESVRAKLTKHKADEKV